MIQKNNTGPYRSLTGPVGGYIWPYFQNLRYIGTSTIVYEVLSLVRRLKHTVLPYNYLYIYACLCARPAWCRDRLNTGRQQPFTARLGPKTRLGAKVFVQVLLQSKYRYGGSYQYCTVEIPTEMEFTGTFQKYLQCVNRMWFSNIRSVCLSRLTDYSTCVNIGAYLIYCSTQLW